MEYISAEEFLKQPKEVQKVFIDWWESNVSKGDLFSPICPKGIGVLNGTEQRIDGLIPLFTEGQIRKLIEDKTEGIVKVVQWDPIQDNNRCGYTIYILAKDRYGVLCEFEYKKLGTDLIQAYWKVACEITSNGGEF